MTATMKVYPAKAPLIVEWFDLVGKEWKKTGHRICNPEEGVSPWTFTVWPTRRITVTELVHEPKTIEERVAELEKKIENLNPTLA